MQDLPGAFMDLKKKKKDLEFPITKKGPGRLE